MLNLMKYLIFLIAISIIISAFLMCAKGQKYECDPFLRVPDSLQTAFITNQFWSPQNDLKTDAVLFQSIRDSSPIDSWRINGYQIQFQINFNQLNSSNLNAENLQQKNSSAILAVAGDEQNIFTPENSLFFKFINSSAIAGVQGKIKLDYYDSNPAPKSMSCFKEAFSRGSFHKNLVRFSKKPLWLTIEPPFDQEMNWPDLWTAYQQTIVALLMHPEINGFHFQSILDSAATTAPISHITGSSRNLMGKLALFNHILHSLNQFKSDDYTWFSAISNVGELVSKSIYLYPDSSQKSKSENFVSALLNDGVPIERLILERCPEKNYLNGYRILFLEYPKQPPLNPDIHLNLARWVKAGGVLILSGTVESTETESPDWVKKLHFSTAIEHLFHCLEIPRTPENKSYPCGKGAILFRQERFVIPENLEAQQHRINLLLAEAVLSCGDEHYLYKPQNYLCLYRGPLILAAVMPDIKNQKMLSIPGVYIDCLSPSCSVIEEKIVAPGEVTLLLNLKKFQTKTNAVILSNSKITNQKLNSPEFSFDSHGPAEMECHTFVRLNLMPREIILKSHEGTVQYQMEWYPQEKLLRLAYPMKINGVQIKLSW